MESSRRISSTRKRKRSLNNVTNNEDDTETPRTIIQSMYKLQKTEAPTTRTRSMLKSPATTLNTSRTKNRRKSINSSLNSTAQTDTPRTLVQQLLLDGREETPVSHIHTIPRKSVSTEAEVEVELELDENNTSDDGNRKSYTFTAQLTPVKEPHPATKQNVTEIGDTIESLAGSEEIMAGGSDMVEGSAMLELTGLSLDLSTDEPHVPKWAVNPNLERVKNRLRKRTSTPVMKSRSFARESPLNASKKSPRIPGTSAQRSPRIPGASVQRSPRNPGASAQRLPRILGASAQRSPRIPGASVHKSPRIPGASVQRSPMIPGTSAQRSPRIPGASDQKSPRIHGMSVQNSPRILGTPVQSSPLTHQKSQLNSSRNLQMTSRQNSEISRSVISPTQSRSSSRVLQNTSPAPEETSRSATPLSESRILGESRRNESNANVAQNISSGSRQTGNDVDRARILQNMKPLLFPIFRKPEARKPPLAPESTTPAADARPKIRQRRPRASADRIPRGHLKSLVNLFTTFNSPVTRDCLDEIDKVCDTYWRNLSSDMNAYVRHAGRNTISLTDVKLLFRRQGLVTDDTSLETLIMNYLPMEYRAELIPCAIHNGLVQP